jgi:hypothetical protein
VRAARLGIAVVLLCAGCGYRLAGAPAPGAGDAGAPAATLAIPILSNESSETGVELLVTDEILREFLRRGAFRLVDDPQRADWVLRGSVLPVVTTGESFSSVILALEYTVTLSLAVRLEARAGDEVALDPATLEYSEIYVASADLEALRKNREEALRRSAQVLASRLHDVLAAREIP